MTHGLDPAHGTIWSVPWDGGALVAFGSAGGGGGHMTLCHSAPSCDREMRWCVGLVPAHLWTKLGNSAARKHCQPHCSIFYP